jgi:predicted Zn-dependent protease
MRRVGICALLLPLIAWPQAGEKEMALGRQLAAMIESREKLISDPVIVEYVNRIGQKVASHSDVKIPLVVKVIASDEPRVETVPGGSFCYLGTRLLQTANSEAELASAIAHGLGHVAVWHRSGGLPGDQDMLAGANVALIPVVFNGLCARGGTFPMAMPMGFLKSQSDAEAQADLLGLDYLNEAGYDPIGLVDLFERILAQGPRGLSAFMPWLKFPATTRSGVEQLRNRPAEYVVTTSEFRDVQRRLTAIRQSPAGLTLRSPTLFAN